jgi:UDP-N-acetylmuramoylalanine-D-glutamate ligase
VQRALKQLAEQLDELVTLASPISHVIEEEPTNAEFDAIRQQLARLTFQVGTQTLPGATVLIAIPPQLIFAQSQTVDTESAPQLLTLFNVGTGSLTIPSPNNNMSVVGDSAGTSAASDLKVIQPDTFPI